MSHCPVCTREITAMDMNAICVEIEGRSCKVIKMKDYPANTTAILCLVHENHLGEFQKMVAAGKYPPPGNSN